MRGNIEAQLRRSQEDPLGFAMGFAGGISGKSPFRVIKGGRTTPRTFGEEANRQQLKRFLKGERARPPPKEIVDPTAKKIQAAIERGRGRLLGDEFDEIMNSPKALRDVSDNIIRARIGNVKGEEVRLVKGFTGTVNVQRVPSFASREPFISIPFVDEQAARGFVLRFLGGKQPFPKIFRSPTEPLTLDEAMRLVE